MSEHGESKALRPFRGTFFRIGVPEEWEELIIEDIPSFFDPEGGGALQFAAFRQNDAAVDLALEMTRYLGNHGIEFSEDHVVRYQTPSGHSGMACEFEKEDRFWMVNLAAKADRLLFIIYNSDTRPDQELALTLSRVIQTLEID